MNKIDYKIFVPRGANNYVRFDTEMEFEVSQILTIGIHIADDKVNYWLDFKIPQDDEHHKCLLQLNKTPDVILLIGNNPYEIHGKAKVHHVSLNTWEEKIQITLLFEVINASETINNPRKEIKRERWELLDL